MHGKWRGGYTADYYNIEGIATVISSIISILPVKLTVNVIPLYPSKPAVSGSTIPYVRLRPGTIIDRYGDNEGTWASPVGIPYGARSIPEGKTPYSQYKVLKEIEVEQSLANPGYQKGQYGYGIQYKFKKKISEYIDEGYLKQIK